MSIQSLKLSLDGRTGRDLFPGSFPMDLLIALSRALAMVADASLSHDEMMQMTKMLETYLHRIFALQGSERLIDYQSRSADLLPKLAEELLASIFEEMVSRHIEYSVRTTSLRERFIAILDEEKVFS